MKLTPEEVLKQSFDCCRQIVQSYGSNDLPRRVRDNLCRAMDHYEKTTVLDNGVNENEPSA
jgi:hypothetical protein